MSMSGRAQSLPVLPAEVPLYAMDMSQQSVFGGMGTVCSTRLRPLQAAPGEVSALRHKADKRAV